MIDLLLLYLLYIIVDEIKQSYERETVTTLNHVVYSKHVRSNIQQTSKIQQ